MVGMSDSAYWASWYLSTLIVYIPPLLILVVIVTGTSQLFGNASFGLVLVFYLFYVLSIIPMAFIVSIFFNKVQNIKDGF